MAEPADDGPGGDHVHTWRLLAHDDPSRRDHDDRANAHAERARGAEQACRPCRFGARAPEVVGLLPVHEERVHTNPHMGARVVLRVQREHS